MRRLITLDYLTKSEADSIINLAAVLREDTPPDALKNRVLGLLFFNASIRTLASFQSAMARMGGSSFVITPGKGSWELEWRDGITMNGSAAEHVREAVPALCAYADALGVRIFGGPENISPDFSDLAFSAIDKACPKPLINLESAVAHPCQALADWRTLDDNLIPSDGKFVLSWASHPKHLPLAVPASAAGMAAKRGMDVVVLRPESRALPEALAQKVAATAAKSGGSFSETSDQDAALENAHVVYAKSWGPASNESQDHEVEGGNWTINSSWFKHSQPECKFMHCLPVRREVVVTADVLESSRSIVQEQAANRLYAQMAVLYKMLAGQSEGSNSNHERGRLAPKHEMSL